jgi:hypothetical protein
MHDVLAPDQTLTRRPAVICVGFSFKPSGSLRGFADLDGGGR